MSIYSKYILPKLLDRDMRSLECSGVRSDVAKNAKGTVLEIGFGSGYNLPFYKDIGKLYALEPSRELYDLAKERVASVTFQVEYLHNSAEKIPLSDHTIDVVVSTWVLCSIPDADKALREIARILKPGGRFIFVEHGRSPDRFFARLQSLLTPVTRNFTGNCHLDRKIDELIVAAGFEFIDLKMLPESGRPLMFSYAGMATPLSHTI